MVPYNIDIVIVINGALITITTAPGITGSTVRRAFFTHAAAATFRVMRSPVSFTVSPLIIFYHPLDLFKRRMVMDDRLEHRPCWNHHDW